MEWKDIAKEMPTWEFCDGIGVDSETVYIVDLTTKEKFDIANNYLINNCKNKNEFIDEIYIGKKVIIEIIYQDNWYSNHGTLDEYLDKIRLNLFEYFL